MAQSLRPAGAIATLEDAVHLLRRAPAGTLICHFAGSAPFALGVLFFWNAVTNPRTSGALIAESLVLALLLVWMNCFRAIFAGRLRSLLGGSPDSPWTAARVWRLVSDQSLLGATRLLAIPFAVLIVFPLAAAVAFYRYAGRGPDREGPQARVHRPGAELDPAAPAFSFCAWWLRSMSPWRWRSLPHLARILTGYESGFSRSGVYYI